MILKKWDFGSKKTFFESKMSDLGQNVAIFSRASRGALREAICTTQLQTIQFLKLDFLLVVKHEETKFSLCLASLSLFPGKYKETHFVDKDE